MARTRQCQRRFTLNSRIKVAHIFGKEYPAAEYICTRCRYRELFVDVDHEITLDEATGVYWEVRRLQ